MAVAHRVRRGAAPGGGRAGPPGRGAGELGEFVAAIGASDELRSLLRNPQIEPHVKHDALAAALEGADPLVRNFLLLLAEKGRIAEVEEIQRELERLVALQARARARATDDGDRAVRPGGGQARRADRAGIRTAGRGHAKVDPDLIEESSSRPARSASTRACAAAGPATAGTDSKELRIT